MDLSLALGTAASLCISALLGAALVSFPREGLSLPLSRPTASREIPPCVCHCDFSVQNGKDFEIYLVVGAVVAVALLFFLLGWCARSALASSDSPSSGKGKHRPVYTLASLQQ